MLDSVGFAALSGVTHLAKTGLAPQWEGKYFRADRYIPAAPLLKRTGELTHTCRTDWSKSCRS